MRIKVSTYIEINKEDETTMTHKDINEAYDTFRELIDEVYCNRDISRFSFINTDTNTSIEDDVEEYTIKELKNMDFEEVYNYLHNNEIGDWDNINNEDTIKQYCNEMMNKGIRISHIIVALENNPSKYNLYNMCLDNSLETPKPINNVNDLLNALGLNSNNEED